MKQKPILQLLTALFAGAVLLAGCQTPRTPTAAARPHPTPHPKPRVEASRAPHAEHAGARAGVPEQEPPRPQARAMMIAAAPAQLTGSVPRTASRNLNGGGTTGSIACEFTGTQKPATKWWVSGYATKRNVMSAPATAVPGYPADGMKRTICFSTTVANTKAPPATSVDIFADKTTVLLIQYNK